MPAGDYEQHIYSDPDFPFISHVDLLHAGDEVFAHWHENIELLHVRRGRIVVTCDSVPTAAERGDLVVVNSGAIHTIRADGGLALYDCLIADWRFLNEAGFPLDEYRLSTLVKGSNAIDNSFSRIRFESRKRSPYYRIAIRAEVLSLFAELFRTSAVKFGQMSGGSGRLDMVRAALSYIFLNYRKPIAVEDVCKSAGFSKYYLCRTFKEVTGRTIVQTINHLRCRYARQLLMSGSYTVGEACERSGFRNLSYFAKVYKEQAGILPSKEQVRK
ncbi:MAG: AraC family transcriptional regulator [Christensenellales bacterium]|jgi:AraC-like DNA-binding protein